MRKTTREVIFTLLILGFSLSSCSLPEKLWKPLHLKRTESATNSRVQDHPQIEKTTEEESLAPKSAITNLSAVEIEWIVPSTRVTKYILRYGFSEDDLSDKIEITRNSLTPITDTKHGAVYRYLLSGIPANSTVYYTLQAGNELGYSEPTPVNTAKSYK